MSENGSSRAAGAYCFVEHGGEVEVELEAATEAAVFAAALAAFRELIELDAEGEPATHEIELAAEDHALLLVDWLSELVFLAEMEEFVPERVVTVELDGGALRAEVSGRRGSVRHLVKAVTLHDLELRREGGLWHGRVVLDV
ncbi:MAG: archease [Kineosporiaceae bacterium]